MPTVRLFVKLAGNQKVEWGYEERQLQGCTKEWEAILGAGQSLCNVVGQKVQVPKVFFFLRGK